MTTMGTTTTSGPAAAADAAKGAASDVASEATSAVADVTETAKTEVRSVVSDATERASQVVQTTRSELRDQVTGKTQSLASTLESVAQQLASMADRADEPDSTVAQLSRTAAEQIRRGSRRLDEGGLEGIVDDARRLARNRPGLFVLGSVAAGFAVGRLAKHADLKQAVDSAKQELTAGDQQPGDQQPGDRQPGAAGQVGAASQVGEQAVPQTSAIGIPSPAAAGTAGQPPGGAGPTGTVLVEGDPGAYHVGDQGGEQR